MDEIIQSNLNTCIFNKTNKTNYNDVLWLSTGECILKNKHNNSKNTNTPFIQLDKNRLKAPFVRTTNNIYRIRSLDNKILNVDFINNRLYFENNDENILKYKNNMIISTQNYIFKVQMLDHTNTKQQDERNIHQCDHIYIKIQSIYVKDSSTNFDFTNYKEHKLDIDINYYMSFDENYNVVMSQNKTLFKIFNESFDCNADMTYGNVFLIPYGHKNMINVTCIPIILPFLK